MATTDVVIIGGGIVGSACAEAFAREGFRTAIVDSEVIGGGATAAGMGHVVVMDDNEAQFGLTRYSQQLWRKIVDQLPEDCEFDGCGTLWVAADEEELAVARKKKAFFDSRGVRAEVLDSKSLLEAEPNLRPGLAGGYLLHDDFIFYPPCVARYLIESVVTRGIQIHTGVEVTAIEGNSVKLSNGTALSADIIVVASGAFLTKLLPEIPITPRKGHLAVTDRYPGFARHQVLELGYLKSAHSFSADSVAFNIQPRKSGQMLIGSSRQFGVTHKEIDWPLLRRMLRRGMEYMPKIGELKVIRTWTGFRAATPDKLPLIGPAPGHEHVYLAAGQEGLGATNAAGSAQLLVDYIMKRETAIPIEPFLPERIKNMPAPANH